VTRVGLIRNPASWSARGDAAPPPPGIPAEAPESVADVPAALDRLARAGVDLLAVEGGDGTLREVLTALPAAFPGGPPDIAVLASGKTNMAARDVGTFGRGARGLGRLLDAVRAGRPLRASTRRALSVAGADGAGPPVRGLLLGAGAFAEGVRIANRRVHALGIADAAAVALSAAGIAFRTAFGRDGRLRDGAPLRIEADGRPLPAGPRFAVVATTLEGPLFGLRPFGPGGTGPIAWLDVAAPPVRPAAAALAMAGARDDRWLDSHGYASGRAAELRLALDEPFVLDGEMFDPGGAGIVLTAPDAVRFVAP
jgi:hypothetical protein